MVASREDRPPSRAAEAEKALLGALLLDSAKAWPLVREVVSETHLARPDHRLIYVAIAELMYSRGAADPALVIDHLGGQLEAAGGPKYITELYDDCPSASNVRAYADLVVDAAASRKVVDITQEIAARARLGTAADAVQHATEALAKVNLGTAQALDCEPVSAWADSPEPAPREWLLEGLIPAGRVTSLIGNGGLGKTMIALQVGLHISSGRPLFGLQSRSGPVLGLFCEDEQDELNRRLRAACVAEGLSLADVDRFTAISRDGSDSVLCTFEREHIQLTPFYAQLEATVAALKPVLLILDTAADLFAGDFMSTPQVRQFLKVALGGLAVRHSCAVLLLGHPSAAGMASGDGGGFSTAWSNSVRGRLYLRSPKQDADEPADSEGTKHRRVLEVRKSNYATNVDKLQLVLDHGCFTLDTDPVEHKPRQSFTALSGAVLDYLRARPIRISSKELLTAMQESGHLEFSYERARKQLQRTLDKLVRDALIEQPARGNYRAKPP